MRWKDGGRDVLGESSKARAKPNMFAGDLPRLEKGGEFVKGDDLSYDIEELSLMIRSRRRTDVLCQQSAKEISCCDEAMFKMRCHCKSAFQGNARAAYD